MYWISLGFTGVNGFHRVSTAGTGFYWFFFTEFFLGFYRFLSVLTGFYLVLLGFTEFSGTWVLLVSLSFHVLGFIGFLPSFIEFL